MTEKLALGAPLPCEHCLSPWRVSGCTLLLPHALCLPAYMYFEANGVISGRSSQVRACGMDMQAPLPWPASSLFFSFAPFRKEEQNRFKQQLKLSCSGVNAMYGCCTSHGLARAC